MSSSQVPKSRCGCKVFATVTIGLFVLFLGVVYIVSQHDKVPQRPFDAPAWKATLGKRGSVERLAMTESLVNSDSSTGVIGKSREEIDRLLGAAEPQNYFKNFDQMYRLGPAGRLFKMQRFLVLRFDEEGKCVEVDVLSD